MTEVYKAVSARVKKSLSRLHDLEEAFYGSNRTANLEIKANLPFIREVRQLRRLRRPADTANIGQACKLVAE